MQTIWEQASPAAILEGVQAADAAAQEERSSEEWSILGGKLSTYFDWSITTCTVARWHSLSFFPRVASM